MPRMQRQLRTNTKKSSTIKGCGKIARLPVHSCSTASNQFLNLLLGCHGSITWGCHGQSSMCRTPFHSFLCSLALQESVYEARSETVSATYTVVDPAVSSFSLVELAIAIHHCTPAIHRSCVCLPESCGHSFKVWVIL